MAILVPGVLLTILALVVCLWAGSRRPSRSSSSGRRPRHGRLGLLETIRWKYTITNRRVFVRHGLVSINEQTARLERVQDITLHQTLFDRMFGVGKLQIDTAGSSGGALEFKALLEPTRCARCSSGRPRRAARRRRVIIGREPAGTRPRADRGVCRRDPHEQAPPPGEP